VNLDAPAGKKKQVGATVTDAALIEASLESPETFAGLFDRHFAAVHRYLQRRLDEHLADELAADTFVTAFSARSRFDRSRESALPWLYGIAANLARHQLRKSRRGRAAFARVDREGSADEWATVDSRLDAEAAAQHLTQALATLAEGDREALLLHAWEDLSYAEIAQALEIPVGTVKSRISRSRAQLREHLTASGQVLDEETPRSRHG
jgi:RNA polymerase sigma-70 factor (ECF subfamily)